MAYDPAKRHHWQMNVATHPVADGASSEVVAVCELCGTVRRYDLGAAGNTMILGGTCPGTSPEPAE